MGSVMRAGFEQGSGIAPVFEGESRIEMRFCERPWRYRQESIKVSEALAIRIRDSTPPSVFHELTHFRLRLFATFKL